MNSDLTQLATSGQPLARVDDVDYVAIAVVLACPQDGTPSIYCQRVDWHTTPVARVVDLLQSNTELRTKVAQLAARVAELEAASAPIICPDCGKDGWSSARALQMHRQRAHQGMVAGKPARRMEDDQGWRCNEPGCSGAFARDMHDPDHCIRHAQRTNGVEAHR